MQHATARMTRGGEEGSRQPLLTFADHIRFWLEQQPRQLPTRYLYDSLGSALFDAICQLPWYPVWRAELALLQRHAPDLASLFRSATRVVELGCGSGDKLARLVEALPTRPLNTVLVDVSPSALVRARERLAALPGVCVSLVKGTYETGLLRAGVERETGRTIVVFFGSNLGNFEPEAASVLLEQVRDSLRDGDWFLVGADIVKPEEQLLLAYDDPLGVTAAFNKNLLLRVNRELGGNFDIDSFLHRAVWNPDESRVEMHLVSQRGQDVAIRGADLRFSLRKGEAIWTESSYKYTPSALRDLVEPAGFSERSQWIDASAGFSLTAFEAVR